MEFLIVDGFWNVGIHVGFRIVWKVGAEELHLHYGNPNVSFIVVEWTLVGGFLLTRNYCGCFSREDSWRLWNLLYGLMIKLNEILIRVGVVLLE